MIEEDPHGMVELFATRLDSNLQIMGPRAATEDALVAVKRHLDASEFVNFGHKGSTGREYVRVDRRPETVKKRGGGGVR